MPPKVSVVTAIYNGEKYIEKLVNSMLGQTFKDFEFIIVDDGSTDSTVKKLENMHDSRICLVRQTNQGQTNALIKGIKKARGDLIARSDQDDFSLPTRLMSQVEFMDSHPKVILCGSRWQELSGNNLLPQRIKFVETNEEIKKIICRFNPFAHSAVMFRRDAYFKIGGYNKSFVIGMDYDLFVRLMEIGEVHNIKNILTIIQMHSESTSMKKSRLKTLEGIKIRYSAYSKFGGNPLITGYFFLKSILGLVLPKHYILSSALILKKRLSIE